MNFDRLNKNKLKRSGRHNYKNICDINGNNEIMLMRWASQRRIRSPPSPPSELDE